ncbi:putative YrdC-like domain, DHBP synthase RibB-like alpha/beta domain superfamily [Dioscorea sansibarensis]
MLSPSKFTERLPRIPFSGRALSLWCPTRSGNLNFLQDRRRSACGLWGHMTQNSKQCDMRYITKAGVILPASEDHVEEAISAIKDEKVIAVPTDTLYGFACDACVADVSDISRFAILDHLPPGLLDCLLPGPVTVVLSRGDSSDFEKSLNPGLDSIGVRVPDSNFIRAIARGCRSALALTSANLSGQPSSVSTTDFQNLWEHCACVFDGGLLPAGRAGSTVVDLTKPGTYKILRPGSAREATIAILEKFCLEEAS